MPSFTRLLALAALVATASAATIASRAACANPVVEISETVTVNGKDVKFETLSCPSSKVAARSTTVRVCGVACTNTCNDNAGQLPPITEDCQQIKDAITIFALDAPPSFTLSPGQSQVLTFGTCSFSFVNTGPTNDLEYCWADLSSTASRAGSACFPPVMPVMSEGLCASADGTWQVIAAHSPPSS